MVLLVLLLLHNELGEICMVSALNTVDVNLFTIWSLVIVLVEIMMKDILEDIIWCFVGKRLGVNLEWY